MRRECVRKPNKRKDSTFYDDVYDAPLHTNEHSTSWRFDLSGFTLETGSPQWVLAGHPRYAGAVTTEGRGWLNHDHAHAQVTHKRLTRDVSNKGADHPAMVAEPSCELRQYRAQECNDSNNDHSASFDRWLTQHWLCDQDERRVVKNITHFMNAVKNTSVPESSVLGTTDMHEEKSVDSVIQYIRMLEGTVQAIVPEFPRPEMITPPPTKSTVKKRSDRLVMY